MAIALVDFLNPEPRTLRPESLLLILEASRRSVNCNGRNCGRSGVVGGRGGGQKKSALPLRKRQWEKALWTQKATQGDVPQARLVLSRMLKNRA